MKNPLVIILLVGIVAIIIFAIYMANKMNKNIHSNLNYIPVGTTKASTMPSFDIGGAISGIAGLFGKKDTTTAPALSTTRPSNTFDSNGMINSIQPKQFNF